jgi:putative Holliday junction resolvase
MPRDTETDSAAGIGVIVVGLPRRLNGDETGQTGPAREIAASLARLTGLSVHLQDERLSSHEAESLLRLDAAAAAVILQDYLDRA